MQAADVVCRLYLFQVDEGSRCSLLLVVLESGQAADVVGRLSFTDR